jgi:methylmalonyl-CoA/ethylmalonyl-CoA epimerase
MVSETRELRLEDIGQIAVTAHDLERAVAYYRDTLGIPFLFEVPGMAFFQCGSVRLMLAVPEGEHAHPSSILYFRVDDVERAHAVLARRGAAFVAEPRIVHRTDESELWMAFFRDSEGNTLAVMAEKESGAI